MIAWGHDRTSRRHPPNVRLPPDSRHAAAARPPRAAIRNPRSRRVEGCDRPAPACPATLSPNPARRLDNFAHIRVRPQFGDECGLRCSRLRTHRAPHALVLSPVHRAPDGPRAFRHERGRHDGFSQPQGRIDPVRCVDAAPGCRMGGRQCAAHGVGLVGPVSNPGGVDDRIRRPARGAAGPCGPQGPSGRKRRHPEGGAAGRLRHQPPVFPAGHLRGPESR